LNKFNTVAKVTIGVIFSIIALIFVIALSLGRKDGTAIVVMAYLVGISIGPNILYEFANPWLKLYLVTGPIGLAFVKLSVKVFAADMKISKTEIEKLKKYMTTEFGEEIGEAAEKYVKSNNQNTETIYKICHPLVEMSYSDRIGVISQLFAMAVSDGEFCTEEEVVILKIAHYLRVGKKRYNIIKSNILNKSNINNSSHSNQNTTNQQSSQGKGYQFLNQFFMPAYNPFVILGLENSASNDDIKKAYRDLVKKYHPDVLTNKSDLIKKQAKEKFHEINNAYESIKKMRGIK
jgi:DnaJ like chaperone protein